MLCFLQFSCSSFGTFSSFYWRMTSINQDLDSEDTHFYWLSLPLYLFSERNWEIQVCMYILIQTYISIHLWKTCSHSYFQFQSWTTGFILPSFFYTFTLFLQQWKNLSPVILSIFTCLFNSCVLSQSHTNVCYLLALPHAPGWVFGPDLA